MCLRTSPSSRPRSVVISRSSTNTRPLSGCIRPMMWRSVTLLPVPLRPSRQNAVPGAISNDTSSSTASGPKRFETRSKRTALIRPPAGRRRR